MNADEDLRDVDVQQGVIRLRPTREKRKDGIGDFRADHGRQFLARRAPHARQAAERRQQRPAPARPDARHVVELRSQIAHRPRAAMKRDREAMRFVADALDQQQRRIVGAERDRILAIARVEQLFFLRDADRDEVREPELLERRVRRRQLSLAAVDQRRDRETVRPARAACGSAAARLRASRRSRPATVAGLGTRSLAAAGSDRRTSSRQLQAP